MTEWNDRLQMSYSTIVEYRRTGGITDDVWADLMRDKDFAKFAAGKNVEVTPDEGNSADPEEFSPALKSYYERYAPAEKASINSNPLKENDHEASPPTPASPKAEAGQA